MAFSESESVAYGGILNSDLHRGGSPTSHSTSSTSKQNSIFSLTLDEIQLKSGKSFGSMNMDEFLSNLWDVEEYQEPSLPNNQTQPNTNRNNDKSGQAIAQQAPAAVAAPPPPPLPRQGSFSIPVPLCKKTVDEVWVEIQKDFPDQRKPCSLISDNYEQEPPERQQTFGEMTLEDFLVKAGVVQESSASSRQKNVTTATPGNPPAVAPAPATVAAPQMAQPPHMVPVRGIPSTNASLDASFGMGSVVAMGFPTAQNAAAFQMFAPTQAFIGDPHQPSASVDNGNANALLDPAGAAGRKRIIDGPPEVVVERRQRRMIKNRESAARSRARKQAYTVELELELNQLKEENARLKELLEEIEEKQKEKEEVLDRKQPTLAEKKAEEEKALKRTVSAGW